MSSQSQELCEVISSFYSSHKLEEVKIIGMMKQVSTLSVDTFAKNEYMSSAYLAYKRTVDNHFKCGDIKVNLDHFSDNFIQVVIGDENRWGLAGIAKYYLALYKGKSFGIIRGQDPTDILKSELYNFITSKEGMKLWIKWMWILTHECSENEQYISKLLSSKTKSAAVVDTRYAILQQLSNCFKAPNAKKPL
jgi:hypothetical protein